MTDEIELNKTDQEDNLESQEVVNNVEVEYSTFFRKLGALIIDFLFIIVVQVIFSIILSLIVPDSLFETLVPIYGALITVIFVIYYAGFESSKHQGTIGKIVSGIIVTDNEGNRISFLRGLGRYFARFISALTMFIGYLVCLFTPKRRCLHDVIAGTLVVNKRKSKFWLVFIILILANVGAVTLMFSFGVAKMFSILNEEYTVAIESVKIEKKENVDSHQDERPNVFEERKGGDQELSGDAKQSSDGEYYKLITKEYTSDQLGLNIARKSVRDNQEVIIGALKLRLWRFSEMQKDKAPSIQLRVESALPKTFWADYTKNTKFAVKHVSGVVNGKRYNLYKPKTSSKLDHDELSFYDRNGLKVATREVMLHPKTKPEYIKDIYGILSADFPKKISSTIVDTKSDWLKLSPETVKISRSSMGSTSFVISPNNYKPISVRCYGYVNSNRLISPKQITKLPSDPDSRVITFEVMPETLVCDRVIEYQRQEAKVSIKPYDGKGAGVNGAIKESASVAKAQNKNSSDSARRSENIPTIQPTDPKNLKLTDSEIKQYLEKFIVTYMRSYEANSYRDNNVQIEDNARFVAKNSSRAVFDQYKITFNSRDRKKYMWGIFPYADSIFVNKVSGSEYTATISFRHMTKNSKSLNENSFQSNLRIKMTPENKALVTDYLSNRAN